MIKSLESDGVASCYVKIFFALDKCAGKMKWESRFKSPALFSDAISEIENTTMVKILNKKK